MTRHLIAGFGTNQTRESLEVFLRSAREVLPRDQGDVALITNRSDGIADLAAQEGVLLIHTPSTYSHATGKRAKAMNRGLLHLMRLTARVQPPEIRAGYDSLLETWHHPHFARWFAYKRVLGLGRWDKVMLCDTKDVVFQAPFFDRLPDDSVSLFEDGETFAPDAWNTRWYRQAFGARALTELEGQHPICIGTLGGPRQAVLAIVTELCGEIARHPFGAVEQARFNRMLIRNAFETPVTRWPNYELVATLVGELNVTLPDDRICAADGRILPVVHMYDRFEAPLAAVRRRYGLGGV